MNVTIIFLIDFLVHLRHISNISFQILYHPAICIILAGIMYITEFRATPKTTRCATYFFRQITYFSQRTIPSFG